MSKSRSAVARSKSIDHQLDEDREKKEKEIQLLILGEITWGGGGGLGGGAGVGRRVGGSRSAVARSKSIDHQLDEDRETKEKEIQLLILGEITGVEWGVGAGAGVGREAWRQSVGGGPQQGHRPPAGRRQREEGEGDTAPHTR